MSSERKLILTIGLPRSGKTTWALQQGCPVVSGDAIRLAIFGKLWWPPGEHQVMTLARTMVRSLFFAGHPTVIFDSVNVTEYARQFWIPTSDCLWSLEYTVVNTPAEVCIQRAIECGQEYLIPVIEDNAERYDDPSKDTFDGKTKDDWNECDFFD